MHSILMLQITYGKKHKKKQKKTLIIFLVACKKWPKESVISKLKKLSKK